MNIAEALRPLGQKDRRFLLEHFWASVSRCSIPIDSALTVLEQEWLFNEISRRQEKNAQYGSGERLTWRREHLSSEELKNIQRPRVDEFIRRRLSELGAGGGSPAGPAWPDGHRFAFCITHDMDTVSAHNWPEGWRRLWRTSGEGAGIKIRKSVQALRATASGTIRRSILRSPDRHAGIAEWMQLESRYGFKSTLFFLAGNIGPWHPYDCTYELSDKVPFGGTCMTVSQVMHEVAQSGWEVGLHGSYHSATSEEVLRMQKEACERAAGESIVSVRQHTLQYNLKSSPLSQSRAGLSVDSTQGFNDMIGFRAGTSFPYLCWDWQSGATLPLLEVPLHIQDGPLMRNSPTVDDAIASCISMMRAVEQVNGCLVILWHPMWLATDAGLAVFETVLQEAKNREAWGCSVRELAAWWTTRSNGILNGSEGRNSGLTAWPAESEERIL
jgi:hypothetical protein